MILEMLLFTLEIFFTGELVLWDEFIKLILYIVERRGAEFHDRKHPQSKYRLNYFEVELYHKNLHLLSSDNHNNLQT